MPTLLSNVVFIGMVMYMQESRVQILFSGYSNYMSNVCNYHMFLLCMYVAMIYVISKCLKCIQVTLICHLLNMYPQKL